MKSFSGLELIKNLVAVKAKDILLVTHSFTVVVCSVTLYFLVGGHGGLREWLISVFGILAIGGTTSVNYARIAAIYVKSGDILWN